MSATSQTAPNINEPPKITAGRSMLRHRVAFLGTGYIADWHARAIAKVRNVELVAVCDQVLPKAHALAAKYGVPNSYGSLEEMLAAEKLDAVHVLLPPDRHYDAARRLIDAGVGVLLEKPMCDSTAKCDALVNLAEQRGVRIGVGHNFLFSHQYEQLRSDVRSGILGHVDHVSITWHRPLPPIQHGPFNIWMLRDPRNIMFEIGSHSVAHMLDLVGQPQEMFVHASNATVLPTGQTFFRRWQVNAFRNRTAIELRFSFVPSYAEYTIHVRGSLGSATVDFERSTYTLQQHRPTDPDFDVYQSVTHAGRSLRMQARRTLVNYFRSKLDLGIRGNPYGATIASVMDAFYVPLGSPLDARIDARTGARVIRICEEIGSRADLAPESLAVEQRPYQAATSPVPRILVLGATGFIGKELVRQLTEAGRSVRILVATLAICTAV